MSERSEALTDAIEQMEKIKELPKPSHPDIVQTMAIKGLTYALIAIADVLETMGAER